MEWPKLKSIILILLAFTNLSLLVLLGGPAWEYAQLQQKNRLEAITLLREKGIEIAEETVPQEMDMAAQTVIRELQGEQLLAEKLLGKELNREVLGGEVYRYENEKGSIQFHSDGSFSAKLDPAVFSVGEEPQKIVLALLDKLDYQGEVLNREEKSLTVGQYWKGYALFDRQVTVCWDDVGLTQLEQGSRLIGTPVQIPGQKTLTVATALITLLNRLDELGDVYSQVHEICQGYVSTTVLSGPMELIPVWRITTDTGIYQLNMVNGQLSRVS